MPMANVVAPPVRETMEVSPMSAAACSSAAAPSWVLAAPFSSTESQVTCIWLPSMSETFIDSTALTAASACSPGVEVAEMLTPDAAVICAADMLVEKYTPCEMVIAAISAMTAVNDSTSIEP